MLTVSFTHISFNVIKSQPTIYQLECSEGSVPTQNRGLRKSDYMVHMPRNKSVNLKCQNVLIKLSMMIKIIIIIRTEISN